MIAFVRHGQTVVNRRGLLQGRVDVPLTDLGRSQAEAVAEVFEVTPPARVLSSPLVRARETAEIVAARFDLTVEVDGRLVELDYGEWDERAVDDVSLEEWASWLADPDFAPPGGESLRAVRGRVSSLCDEVLGDELVVAVSHVSPIKAAVAWALDVDDAVTWRMFLELASITRLARRRLGVALVSFNETAHLTDGLRP